MQGGLTLIMKWNFKSLGWYLLADILVIITWRIWIPDWFEADRIIPFLIATILIWLWDCRKKKWKHKSSNLYYFFWDFLTLKFVDIKFSKLRQDNKKMRIFLAPLLLAVHCQHSLRENLRLIRNASRMHRTTIQSGLNTKTTQTSAELNFV